MPSIGQIDEMPALVRQPLPPHWQDLNGHVNVQYYMHLYDLAGAPLFDTLGINVDLVNERHCGWFELEHHVWYLRELHVGEEVTVHCRFIARNKKRLHGMLFLANQTRRALASALEFVSTAADLDARSSALIPEDIAQRLDARIEQDRAFGWTVPTSGAMAI